MAVRTINIHLALIAAGFFLGIAGTAYAQTSAAETGTPVYTYVITTDDTTVLALRKRLEDNASAGRFPETVRRFYAARDYKPVWSAGIRTLPISDVFKAMLDGIESEGLDPDRPAYHRARISALMESGTVGQSDRLALLDLLLTDAFFTLGRHLHFGVAHGAELGFLHADDNRPLNMGSVLEDAAAREEIRAALLSLAPDIPEYRRLRKALAAVRTRAVSAAWSTDPADYAYERHVRQRLIASGDLNDTSPVDLQAYDPLLEAVKRFQRRNNIKADGMVGPATAAKMAESPGTVAEKIALNMERWKWLPPRRGDTAVVVNIPGFELSVQEGNKSVLNMQAIVGRRERETPTFAATLRYIIFNPYWRVPKTILREDLIPKLKKDPGYLQKKNIKIFSAGDAAEKHPIDPATIAWKRWNDAKAERYIFREEPGPHNPLGYVKFIFPNDYDIYIHDTPSQALFNNDKGTYSSGCIRIRKPMELAYYLLAREEPDITYKRLFARMVSGKNMRITLKHPVSVYVTYQTVQVDGEGRLSFYGDIYGYDEKLREYLSKN